MTYDAFALASLATLDPKYRVIRRQLALVYGKVGLQHAAEINAKAASWRKRSLTECHVTVCRHFDARISSSVSSYDIFNLIVPR
jgi:hypothetical protein